MFEQWKKQYHFIDDVNIITKLFLGIVLFFFVIFVHHFDFMLYITMLMLIYLLLFNGTQYKITMLFITLSMAFAILSSLFMILYGKGSHTLLHIGFINITTESLIRGLHVALRTMTISFYGILIALTSQVVMIFYSLMQHLKVKPKIAYAFMAAIRMVPIMVSSLIQLRRSLSIRYQMIDRSNYRGFKRIKHLIIPLLSQNIRKAHQLSVAMESKGFEDGPRTYYYYAPFSYKDILFIALTTGIILLAYVAAQYIPITNIGDVRLGRIG